MELDVEVGVSNISERSATPMHRLRKASRDWSTAGNGLVDCIAGLIPCIATSRSDSHECTNVDNTIAETETSDTEN